MMPCNPLFGRFLFYALFESSQQLITFEWNFKKGDSVVVWYIYYWKMNVDLSAIDDKLKQIKPNELDYLQQANLDAKSAEGTISVPSFTHTQCS